MRLVVCSFCGWLDMKGQGTEFTIALHVFRRGRWSSWLLSGLPSCRMVLLAAAWFCGAFGRQAAARCPLAIHSRHQLFACLLCLLTLLWLHACVLAEPASLAGWRSLGCRALDYETEGEKAARQAAQQAADIEVKEEVKQEEGVGETDRPEDQPTQPLTQEDVGAAPRAEGSPAAVDAAAAELSGEPQQGQQAAQQVQQVQQAGKRKRQAKLADGSAKASCVLGPGSAGSTFC